MEFDKITVIGVGLIGGSIGLAARGRKLAARVMGVDRDPRALVRAAELGAIDAYTTELGSGVKDAELVVVCTPVDTIAPLILAAAGHVRPGTLFTDTGSTKRNVIETVGNNLPRGIHYVPAHPIAGSEKSGVENARADLFHRRAVVLIGSHGGPTTLAEERVRKFWEGLGGRVVTLVSSEEHDRVLASTSHLPHVVAAAVARALPPAWHDLSGTGFRDVTRLASGDPRLWAAIFRANRAPVISAVNAFREQLDRFCELLQHGDGTALVEWLAEAKRGRDALGS